MHAVLPVATIILYGLYNLSGKGIPNVERLPSETFDGEKKEVPYQINPKFSSISHLPEILKTVKDSIAYVNNSPNVAEKDIPEMPLIVVESEEDSKSVSSTENLTEASVPKETIPQDETTENDAGFDPAIDDEEERKALKEMDDLQNPKPTMAMPLQENRKSSILESPCPGILTYRGINRMSGAGSLRWTGQIKVDNPLTNVTLDLELDKEPQLIVGEVSSDDNIHYKIINSPTNVSPGIPIVTTIIVRYSGEEPSPPMVKSIKLNGEQICPVVEDQPIASLASSNIPIITTFRPESIPLSIPSSINEFDEPITTFPSTITTIIKSSRPVQTPLPDPTNTIEYVDGVRCGISEVHPPNIYSYRNYAARGEWPWYAAIYQTSGSDLTYLCSGSLIGQKTILTAANCVSSRLSNKPVDPETLVVYLGKYHLRLWSEGGVQNKQVRKINIHPDYNTSDFGANIAVIVLSSPVDFTSYIRPICLWKKNEPQLGDLEDKEGVIVGWGYDEREMRTVDLMINKMALVPQKLCLNSYPEFFSEFSSGSTFCAGFRNDSSKCSGDSGSGLVFPKNDDDSSQQVTWFLGGIFSLCPSEENMYICNKKLYIVFTDVGIHYDWIKKFR